MRRPRAYAERPALCLHQGVFATVMTVRIIGMQRLIRRAKPRTGKVVLVPVRVNQWQTADIVQPLKFVVGQHNIDGAEVAFELFNTPATTTRDATAGRVSNHANAI